MTPCRLVLDGPHSGAWNMALDDVLLTQAADEGIATLRVYQWAPATVSLGYFQASADRLGHKPSQGAPWVRRASGGGALVHDRELTYSLALPGNHPLARGGEALYFAVHSLLVEWLNHDFAPTGRYEMCDRADVPPGPEPWLCFLRRARGDVLYVPATKEGANSLAADGRYKVCGSAQRRRGGAVLQHGSLVLERSPKAPEIPGIGDLSGKVADFDTLAPLFIKKVATELRLDGGDLHGVNPHLNGLADELATTKFEREEWNLRR